MHIEWFCSFYNVVASRRHIQEETESSKVIIKCIEKFNVQRKQSIFSRRERIIVAPNAREKEKYKSSTSNFMDKGNNLFVQSGGSCCLAINSQVVSNLSVNQSWFY